MDIIKANFTENKHCVQKYAEMQRGKSTEKPESVHWKRFAGKFCVLNIFRIKFDEISENIVL